MVLHPIGTFAGKAQVDQLDEGEKQREILSAVADERHCRP